MNKWIDIKTAQPPIHETVLISLIDGDNKRPYVDVSIFDADYNITTFNDWDEGNGFGVTHWMPMPEPPKGE